MVRAYAKGIRVRIAFACITGLRKGCAPQIAQAGNGGIKDSNCGDTRRHRSPLRRARAAEGTAPASPP